METAPLPFYRLEFAKRAEWRSEEELRLERMKQVKHFDERREKQDRDDEAKDDAMLDVVMAVLASDPQIDFFIERLDAYDTATTAALLENDELLKEVREELRILLDQAYVVPDGRKVFKTEDGERIFDEHGVEVTDFDPEMIEDWRPRWEAYENPFEREAALVEDRNDILDFQALSDEIRTEIREAQAGDGISAERLEELNDALNEKAPDSVTAHLPSEFRPAQDAAFAENAKPGLEQHQRVLEMPTLG